MTLIQPDTEMQAFIREELNEDINTRDASLQAIKEWLLKEPHLPDTWEEQALMTFLRGCNFSLERCKKKLDLYFTTRAKVPEFFMNRDVKRPEFQDIINYTHAPPLPGLTPGGRRVVIIRGKDKAVTTPLAEDGMKLLFMIGDIRLLEEKTGVAGDIYILDASVVTPTHFAKVNPIMVRKFLTCVEEAYPVKLKEVHVVNIHPLVHVIFTWVKPFLKEKIVNRVHFHSDGYESLYKFVPKDILPEEYGGTAGKLQPIHDAWIKKLEAYTPWFKEQEKFKADLSKRPGKSTNYEELFGMEGSFQKLNID